MLVRGGLERQPNNETSGGENGWWGRGRGSHWKRKKKKKTQQMFIFKLKRENANFAAGEEKKGEGLRILPSKRGEV